MNKTFDPLILADDINEVLHTGLHHTAQVAEPAGVAPLWQQLSPEIVQRIICRVMCALSLLYRYDLGVICAL
jgi:hypothetical protein